MFLRRIVIFVVCFLALNWFEGSPVSAGQGSHYTVQVETLSFEPAARAVVNRLKTRGFDAYFESHEVAEAKTLYKVRFGRFETRQEADAAAQAYREKEKRDCFVVQTMRSGGAVSRTSAPAREDISSAGDTQVVENDAAFYTVQIAAKTDRAVAQELSERLHQKGYPVYVLAPDPEAVKPFYRIRIGSYTTRAQAEQAGRDYAKRERGDFLVVLSPPERRAAVMKPAPAGAGPASPEQGSGYVFTVQVCVRETRATAETYAAQMRVKGFDAYITQYEAPNGKILYRVRIGKFQERAQADEAARAYAQQGGRDYLVVRTEQVVPLEAAGPEPDRELPAILSNQHAMVFEEPLRESEPGQVPERAEPGTESLRGVQAELLFLEETAPAKPADWPERVTKIFAYIGSENELNLTNAYANIPGDLLGRIQYVSIFPVMFVSVPATGSAIVMEVEGERRLVRLSGIYLPSENRTLAVAGIRKQLSAKPLRLKYSFDDERKEQLTGSLYYRGGVDIQLEFLKYGLALVDEESVPSGRHDAFHAAQQRARDLKAGIWSAGNN